MIHHRKPPPTTFHCYWLQTSQNLYSPTDPHIWVMEDFISDAEADLIIAMLPQKRNFQPKRFDRNRIWRWGTKSPYPGNHFGYALPPDIYPIAARLHTYNLLDHIPEHCTVNEYYPGQGIPAHIDKPECGEIISVVSLLADCEIWYRLGDQEVSINLPRNSVMQMSGKARWEWEHEIKEIKDHRYSMVFRN